MRYFTLCLYSEGPSDRPFLERVIHRLVLDLLYKQSNDLCEVQEQFIRFDRKPSGKKRADYILEQVEKLQNAITMIFVHSDGAGNPDAALATNCLPSTSVINGKYDSLCGIPVVPVRETEAWALADAGTITKVTGGKPYALPKNPETIGDPKVPLREITKLANALSTTALMAEIADGIPIDSLRKVASFKVFEDMVIAQLIRLGAI